MARVFYLPASGWVINIENLPTEPLDPRAAPDASGQDKVERAETIAREGAFVRDVESYLPKEAPGADQRMQPDALRQAIVGSWNSPFGTVTFREDGNLSARLSDGSAYSGSWSVDSSGRLNADMMGSPMVAEAVVAGDELTLAMDDQALKLRRTSGL
jgi:hypothetical protein